MIGCLAMKLAGSAPETSPIRFQYEPIPFHLENDETPMRHVPAAMGGGVAILDYNRDGRPDIFFTNGADIQSLKKTSPKYYNHLFRNDGGGKFTDVTEQAGLAGLGYDIGVAVADYDNDGYPDIFVAGVYRSTLYHNNGNGTFTDVTTKAGLEHWNDAQFGPLWAVAGAWVDVNNDGKLDLFVVNYLRWNYEKEPRCTYQGKDFYCHPSFYKGLPNQLFLNNGDGTFRDASEEYGLRGKIGKGMGVGVADYDHDGWPDLFVTNDGTYNSLFHNVGGKKLDEVAFDAGVALPENGNFISNMGLDFRDFNNDGWADIAEVALNKETFPLYRNSGKGDFTEITASSGMTAASRPMAGFGAAIYDFDNDGWKDIFITRGHVDARPLVGEDIEQFNTVFQNQIKGTRFLAMTQDAGLATHPAARHRGCAVGDLDGDGRPDVVTTALGREAEIWMNRSSGGAHWLDFKLEGTNSNRDGIGTTIKVVTPDGPQWNHMTTSFCYASSSDGPVHFGLGSRTKADSVEIRWPSGTVQTMENVAADQVISVKEK